MGWAGWTREWETLELVTTQRFCNFGRRTQPTQINPLLKTPFSDPSPPRPPPPPTSATHCTTYLMGMGVGEPAQGWEGALGQPTAEGSGTMLVLHDQAAPAPWGFWWR